MQKTGIIITLALVTLLAAGGFIYSQYSYKICFNCDADGLYRRGLEYACSDKKSHRRVGLDFIKDAASQGNIKAELILAELYSTTLPAGYASSNPTQRECLLPEIAPEQTTGMSYFESVITAMETGETIDPEVLDNLALLYLEGIFSAEDNVNKASMLYEKAAAEGSYPAMRQLGILANAHGNYTQAMEWFVQAAENPTDASSPLMIGDYYRYGKGVAVDYLKARDWYTKALTRAEKGQDEEQKLQTNTAVARLDMVQRKIAADGGDSQRIAIRYRLEGGVQHFIIFVTDYPDIPLGEVINNNGTISAIMNENLELNQQLQVSVQENFSSMIEGMQWVLTTFAMSTNTDAGDVVFDFVLTKS